MNAPAVHAATYDDLLQVPENLVAEIIHGQLPTLPETAWFELTPDWICEVLSPSTARTDRADKSPIHTAAGAALSSYLRKIPW